MTEEEDRPNLNLLVSAAEAATGAAHMLLTAYRDEFAPDMDDVITALCDAIACAARFETRPQDSQLLGAVAKWFDEQGNPVQP